MRLLNQESFAYISTNLPPPPPVIFNYLAHTLPTWVYYVICWWFLFKWKDSKSWNFWTENLIPPTSSNSPYNYRPALKKKTPTRLDLTEISSARGVHMASAGILWFPRRPCVPLRYQTPRGPAASAFCFFHFVFRFFLFFSLSLINFLLFFSFCCVCVFVFQIFLFQRDNFIPKNKNQVNMEI